MFVVHGLITLAGAVVLIGVSDSDPVGGGHHARSDLTICSYISSRRRNWPSRCCRFGASALTDPGSPAAHRDDFGGTASARAGYSTSSTWR